MFKAKKTIMYIDVKGVDDMTDRRARAMPPRS